MKQIIRKRHIRIGNPVKFIELDGNDWILATGNKVYWYGGKVGNKRNLISTYKATSGFRGPDQNGKRWNLQKAKYQNVRNGGPTPEGRYHINLMEVVDSYLLHYC